MAEFSRFFDSTPSDKRSYSAAEFAEFMKTFYSNGVISGGEKLKVTRDSATLSVSVNPGMAMVEGYWYKNTAVEFLQVTAADTVYPRIDRAVLRLDLSLEARSIRLAVLQGTPAAAPQPPELTRNENIYELSLAQFTIPANAVTVGTVTDERPDSSLCGVSQGLYTADLSDFDAQLQELLETMQAQAQAAVDLIRNMTNEELLAMIVSFDGSGSGIDADKLDGQHGSFYLNYENLNNKPTIESLGGQRQLLSGTGAPSSSLGQDGDLYIQYS